MINTLSITNNLGNTLVLNLRTSDVEEGLLVFNLEGLGPPKTTVDGFPSPNADGLFSPFSRAAERRMSLTLVVVPAGDEEAARQTIYDYFPLKRTVRFRIQTDTKDVYTDAIVESIEMNSFARVENAVIQLVSPESYFSNWTYTNNVEIVQPSGITLNYPGDTDIGAVFKVVYTGYITQPQYSFVNSQYSQIMAIDLTYLFTTLGLGQSQNGDELVVDTRRGQKSVKYYRSSVEYDILRCFLYDTNWIRIGRDTSNLNYINWYIQGLGTITNAKAYVDYRTMYKGV